MAGARVTVTDPAALEAFGATVLVGGAFAFARPEAFRHPSLAWAGALLGDAPARGRVVPLLGRGGVALPGARVAPVTHRRLHLASLTTDRALYLEGRDDVHVLVVDPLSPDAELHVHVGGEGRARASHPLRLDGRGAGHLRLPPLAAGDWELRLSNALPGEASHRVRVRRARAGSGAPALPALRAPVTLSSLGATVRASELPLPLARCVRGLWLDATPGAAPVRLERVDARRARLVATAPLHALSAVMIDPAAPVARDGALSTHTPFDATNHQPDRYARGEAHFQAGRFAEARAEFERARASMQRAHPNYAYYVACCLAREGRVDEALAALREAVREGFDDFAHLATDPDTALVHGARGFATVAGGGARAAQREAVMPGDVIELDVPAPMGILAVGALAPSGPWESCAALLAPDGVSPRVLAPEAASRGDEVSVEVDTCRGDDDVSVLLVVRDARVAAPEGLSRRLARQLTRTAERVLARLSAGAPARPLSQSLVPRASTAAVNAPDPVAALPDGALDDAGVAFAGLVPVRGGVARAEVQLGAAEAYDVEALVVSGLDWGAATARIRVG